MEVYQNSWKVYSYKKQISLVSTSRNKISQHNFIFIKKYFFKTEEKVSFFQAEVLKEFIRSAVQEKLKNTLQAEKKRNGIR